MTATRNDSAGGAHSIAPKTSEEIASSLRLRPERPPVTRLSRKVLASGTALAILLVSAAVLWALQNNRARGPVSEELYSTDHQNVADGLAGLPRDYAGIPRDVPRLGPPLPGDLGRPIIAAQTQSGPLAVDAEQQRMNQEARPREPARSLRQRMFDHPRQLLPWRLPRMLCHRPMRPMPRTDRIASSSSSTPR
jgi:type IV secretion system protein VirB10